MDAVEAMSASAKGESAGEDLVSPAVVAQRADKLRRDGDSVRARTLVEHALAIVGPNAELLWSLAAWDLEFGDVENGLDHIEQAIKVEASAAKAFARRVQVLAASVLCRHALLAAERPPATIRDDPAVRTAVGDYYWSVGCPAHAVDGYGESGGLKRRTLSRKYLSRLRCGGMNWTRIKLYDWEEANVLEPLRLGAPCSALFESISGLTGSDVTLLNALRDEFEFSYHRRRAFWAAVVKWMWRLRAVAVLPSWLVLLSVAQLIPLNDRPRALALPVLGSAVVATLIAILVYSIYLRVDAIPAATLRGVAIMTAISGGSAAACAEGYVNHAFPPTGWQFWSTYGVLASPVILACAFIVARIASSIEGWRIRAILRPRIRFDLIDDFLGILDMMRAHGQRVPWRGIGMASWLDYAAYRVERYLVPTEYVGSVQTKEWLRHRRAGWAEALRYLERELAAPVPDGWQRVEKTLRHEVWCLATGTLGALAWRRPPAPQPRRRVLWQRTAAIIRAVLVAALPLGVVLAAQPVIHASADVFRWTRIATGIWAVLYILLSVDPAISDKVDAARTVVGTLREARSIGKPDASR
jgi:hypothetical protein